MGRAYGRPPVPRVLDPGRGFPEVWGRGGKSDGWRCWAVGRGPPVRAPGRLFDADRTALLKELGASAK